MYHQSNHHLVKYVSYFTSKKLDPCTRNTPWVLSQIAKADRIPASAYFLNIYVIFFWGYFDLVIFFLDNEKIYFLGWPNRKFGQKRSTDSCRTSFVVWDEEFYPDQYAMTGCPQSKSNPASTTECSYLCYPTKVRSALFATQAMYTVGPLTIESFLAKKRVSTQALGALDEPLVVQTEIWNSDRVPVYNTWHL